MGRVDNKTVIITGGAKGIGKSTCRVLAEHGARVAVTDVEEGTGRQVAEEIQSRGGNARFWDLDVSSEKEVERVFREVNQQFGGIHVLVNNAGISGADKPTHEISVQEWDQVMNINIKGVFLCTKHASTYLQHRRRPRPCPRRRQWLPNSDRTTPRQSTGSRPQKAPFQ
jgi:NAD(P)-dependent dehydrogenase (short-subunit alcohol dehydrogenase family)